MCRQHTYEPHARRALSMGIQRTTRIVEHITIFVVVRMFCDMHFQIDTSTLFTHSKQTFMGFIRSAYGSTFPSSTYYVKNVKCAALPISTLFFWCGYKSSLSSISALKNVL